MKKYFLLIIFFLGTGFSYSQTALQRFINNPALKHASVGVSVVELESGKSIVSHDAQKSLTPASTLKLITTATALETLGDNYRYKTEVALDANNPSRILVLGSGDPTLGSEAFGDNKNAFFINAANELDKVLSKDKEYTIYIVDNLFGYDGVAPGWTWIDMGNYYAAGNYGISIFDNSYRLVFNTTDKNSCPRILRTEPEIKGLTFRNALSLNNSGEDNAYIYGEPFSYNRSVRGNIPEGKTEFTIKGDIPDPGLLLGETLADYLSRAGFRIGKIETARNDYFSGVCKADQRKSVYRVGKVIHTQMSPPLKDIIREINVASNNHYTEHLLRTLGRYRNDDIYTDASETGISYTYEYWQGKGVSTSSLQMHDGCGLAPSNAVSPQFQTDLLVYMYNKSSYSKAFYDSLPKVGHEGTVTYFLRNTKLSGKIVAKSGSISGVHCYAGYLIDGNKKYALSIMVNKFNGTRLEVRKAIEQFLLSVVNEI
ncbi:D-alanyl-D-alanine carboxypeptidase/D-alanyl-D-alanine-endopeptidase [Proteiniphilum sp.]|uniref:D-alanyl-D-alanine carboxypeptidase/D-alanyl-D-alanine endopeptidase n=1 Tax=Proteiniphilum sp. TaxID=1926877 RepID=UPI002B2104F4|nr:D-alanyl-D-alanine carboxypeptidase/D-alanyl-D-alanine-endopeptidase [Proteiniphilum sp.]MEA4917415.1 D-alanyl-D-alanine carboxypeptidase/D-alanyl-D-alanine-endopeptidase [Proteiniphilum sp.]